MFFFLFVYSQNAVMEQNKEVSSGLWRNILRFYDLLIFVNFDLRGNVTDCARTY